MADRSWAMKGELVLSCNSKMRAFGRNWNFGGRSAEICKLDWRGR